MILLERGNSYSDAERDRLSKSLRAIRCRSSHSSERVQHLVESQYSRQAIAPKAIFPLRILEGRH
ncbi:hypothetical protein FM036_36550 [Nostoc sp. HG1]|nr:hypothetical protein [Nostoc sp. HG1]